MLYGDFRNEDEPRFYEDLLDYEAVYSLFLEVRSYQSVSFTANISKFRVKL